MAEEFSGKVEFQADGHVKMFLAPGTPGASGEGDYNLYRRTAKASWKLIFRKHHIPDPSGRGRSTWMEETYLERDTPQYRQDIWTPGDTSEPQRLCSTTIEKGRATTCFFHAGRLPYMWGSAQHEADDAQVTYVHSVNSEGQLGEMLSFELIPNGRRDWGNSWTKEGLWDTNSGGWPYGGGGRGAPADMNVQYQQQYRIGWPLVLRPSEQTVDVLPFLKIDTAQSADKTVVETIWDSARTQALQVIYGGLDRSKVIQRTYGRMEKNEWVQTTYRTESLLKWIEDRLRVGGAKAEGESTFDDGKKSGARYSVFTPTIHWPIDTNPNFQQYWSGMIFLQFETMETVDGVVRHKLENIKSDVTWWHVRNDGNWKSTENQPLSRLGVTEADLEALVSRWNARAVLQA